MRTSTETLEARTIVGARTALVLAEPQVWSPSLQISLEALGLSVVACGELHELFEAANDQPAHLLVLAQRNAPFGVRACRVMRGLQDVPMLAVIPSEGDLIPVLDAGADDAVVARTDPAVFTARARALLRRTQHLVRNGGALAIRDLAVDLDKCQATLNDQPVPLTPTEFRLLAVLAQHAGKVIDARSLLSAVHQHDYTDRDAQNLVKVHIANLRRKLNESRSSQNPYIYCVRGFGYMLERRAQRREGDPLTPFIETDDLSA